MSDSGASSSGDAGNPDLSHLHVVPDEFRAEEVHDISRLKLSQKLLEMELEGCDAVEECADRIARKLESIQESHRGSTAASVAARKKLISSLLWDLKEFCECLGIDQVVQMPRIFTLGAQSTGKSTLINTLLHLCVAYTSHSQGTVRPTRIQAVFEPDLEVDFKISVRENRNAAPMEIDPDEIANAIKDLMKDQRVSADPIWVTITTSDPSVGNQDIVDLPGVVAEDKNDPTCSAIRDMIHNILVSCGPQDTVILFSRLNVDGNERNNSSIAGMIPEGMEPVVVLTGADEFDEENAEHFLFEEVRKHMLFMFGSERVLDQGGRLRQEWHPFVVGLPCKKDMRGVDADFRSFRHRWNEVVDGKRRELLDAVRSPDKRDGPLERYDINELEKHIIQRHLSSTRRALSGVPRLLEECARRELGDKLHALSVSLQALENNNLRSVLQDAISDIYDVIHRAVRGKDVWHGRCTIPSRSFQQEVEHAESSIPEEMTWPLPPQHVYLEVNGIGIESGGENPTPEGLCQSYSEQFRMATVLGATSNLGIKFRWLASEMFLRMKRVEVADPPMEVFRNLAGGLEGTNTTAFKPAVTQLLKRVCKCVFQERCCNYVHERLRALLVQLVENAVEEIRGQAKGMRAALEEQCWRVLTERLTRAVERFLGLHMQELRHQLDSRETFPSNRFQALAADLAAGGGDAQPIMNSAKEADEKFNKLEKEFDGDEEKLHRLCVDAFQTHFRLERTLCAQVVMGSVILLQDMVEGIEGKYNLLETLRLFGLEDTKEISLRGWSCLNFGTPETVLQTEPLTTDALERVYGWKGGLEDMRRESHRLLRIDEVTRMGVSALRRGIQELRINEDHET